MDGLQFTQWTALLESRLGVFIAPERRSFLESALRGRMRASGCGSFSDYYRFLCCAGGDEGEWDSLVDEVTVHETRFFRHGSSMRLVEELVLPQAFGRADRIALWSVGCATGEESYSLAMLADAFCRRQGGRPGFEVLGSDISQASLRQAANARYLNRRVADIAPAYQRQYCRQVSDTRFEIVPELREKTEFSRLNLRDMDGAPDRLFDLVYCQNMLIYYDRDSRLQIVNRLAGFLRPGGVMVLGPGELLGWRHADMERLRYDDTLAYRRTY